VVTIGALLGMAAHLEGKGVSVVDMTGLAQKGGAVFSHVRIADRPDAIHSASIAAGEVDAVIGCDLIATVAAEPIERMCPGATRAVVNVSHAVTGDFIANPDWQYPQAAMQDEVSEALGTGNAAFIEGTRLATSLLGDAIATNLFMLGFAYQQGLVPVAADAILRAVELNGTAVQMNQSAFGWGRRAACDPAAVEAIARPAGAQRGEGREPRSLDELIDRRVRFLTGYQDEGYARRYRELVERTRRVERALGGGLAAHGEPLAEAVARSYFRLLAYKDEYEVARLYTDGRFAQQVNAAFEGEFRLAFHFAPPLFARVDPVTGEPRKRRFGPWVLPLLGLLARFKGLRGTTMDPFGRSAERRLDRALIGEYEESLAALLGALDSDNLALAVEIAALPERVRGFGPLRARAAGEMRARRSQLLARLRPLDVALAA
jgi:indolepyruvate ferredoxin oxidoreductase